MNRAAWKVAQRFKISIVDAVKLQADGLYTPRQICEAGDEVLEKAVGKGVLGVLRQRQPHEKRQKREG